MILSENQATTWHMQISVFNNLRSNAWDKKSKTCDIIKWQSSISKTGLLQRWSGNVQYKLVYPTPLGPKGWWNCFSRYQNVLYVYLSVPSNLKVTSNHLTCHLIYCPVFPITLSTPFSSLLMQYGTQII